MVSTSDRRYTRRDTVLVLLCLGLSLFGLFSPVTWGHGVADLLRETVLSPLVWLQTRAEEGRTSRVRFRQVTSERDSTAYLSQFLPSLRAENERLRSKLAQAEVIIGVQGKVHALLEEISKSATPDDDT